VTTLKRCGRLFWPCAVLLGLVLAGAAMCPFGDPAAPAPSSSLRQCEALRQGEWDERLRFEDSLRRRLRQCEQLRQCPQRTICEAECQDRK
jgi:hypothetical protein